MELNEATKTVWNIIDRLIGWQSRCEDVRTEQRLSTVIKELSAGGSALGDFATFITDKELLHLRERG